MHSSRVFFAAALVASFGVGGCVQGPRHNYHPESAANVANVNAPAPVAPVASNAPATTTSAAPTKVAETTGDPAFKNSATALGKLPPEITVDDWIGTTHPVLLRDQGGRIVLLVFCQLDDPRCAPVHDQMRALQEAHVKDGFVNVELMIDQSDDAQGWKRIAEKTAALGLPWAIGYGAKVEYTRLRYGFPTTPAAYLIDTDGKVVWSGVPGPDSTLAKAVDDAAKQGP